MVPHSFCVVFFFGTRLSHVRMQGVWNHNATSNEVQPVILLAISGHIFSLKLSFSCDFLCPSGNEVSTSKISPPLLRHSNIAKRCRISPLVVTSVPCLRLFP